MGEREKERGNEREGGGKGGTEMLREGGGREMPGEGEREGARKPSSPPLTSEPCFEQNRGTAPLFFFSSFFK